MLQVLVPRFDEVIFTRYRNNPRDVAAEELDALARRYFAWRRACVRGPDWRPGIWHCALQAARI